MKEKFIYLVSWDVPVESVFDEDEISIEENETRRESRTCESDFELLSLLREMYEHGWACEVRTVVQQDETENLITELQQAYRVFENINSSICEARDYLDYVIDSVNEAYDQSDDGMSNLADY